MRLWRKAAPFSSSLNAPCMCHCNTPWGQHCRISLHKYSWSFAQPKCGHFSLGADGQLLWQQIAHTLFCQSHLWWHLVHLPLSPLIFFHFVPLSILYHAVEQDRAPVCVPQQSSVCTPAELCVCVCPSSTLSVPQHSVLLTVHLSEQVWISTLLNGSCRRDAEELSLQHQHPALMISYLQLFCPEKGTFLSSLFLAVTILQRNGKQFNFDGWF